MSLAQSPTLMRQQACVVVSLASTLVLHGQTKLRPLQVLLLDYDIFSCCSSSVSTC